MSRSTGAKTFFEVVVVVGRIVARAPLRRREGRELAGEPQQLLEQPLGMDVARMPEMLQHRDVAVEQLQHEVVGALQAAAGGRVGGVAGELLELVVDPADDPVDPAVDDRMRGAGQQRRREFLVEDDGACRGPRGCAPMARPT